MKKKTIVILTANYGNGHLQAACSLKNQLERFSGYNVMIKDLFFETNPLLYEWTKKLYLKSYTKSGRQFYRLFYYTSKEVSKRKNLTVLSYGYAKLCQMIAEVQPDIIINTFPSFAVSHYCLKTSSYIPTYNVLTDYCLHHSWIHPNIDKYYVASEQLKDELVKTGINDRQIVISGIPISESFAYPLNKKQIIAKYRLDQTKKIVLLIAGAYGVSKEMKHVCKLLKDEQSLQLVVVCGNNRQLYHELQEKYQSYKTVKIIGYVTKMFELLGVAACVVTKPGGLILTEAMAMKTPIILLTASPGQEQENARFFNQHGAALWNDKADGLISEIKELLNNEESCLKMKASLEKLHLPNAASTICCDILQDYYAKMVAKNERRI